MLKYWLTLTLHLKKEKEKSTVEMPFFCLWDQCLTGKNERQLFSFCPDINFHGMSNNLIFL